MLALVLKTEVCYNSRKPPSLTIRVCSNLPPSAGLGSSAAYSSCLVSSLLITQGLVAPPSSSGTDQQGSWSGTDIELINQWAFQSEKIIHGRPSGIDNSISTFGKANFYKHTSYCERLILLLLFITLYFLVLIVYFIGLR